MSTRAPRCLGSAAMVISAKTNPRLLQYQRRTAHPDAATVEDQPDADSILRLRSSFQPLHQCRQVSLRNATAGGALCCLERYPCISRCVGIPPAMYWYNSREHRPEFVAKDASTLVREAQTSMLAKMPPDVLICIAARFYIKQSKYVSISYSLILKEVGALFELMYLHAAAMSLSGLRLGCFLEAHRS